MGNVSVDKKNVKVEKKNYLEEMMKYIELIRINQYEVLKLEVELANYKESLATMDNEMMDFVLSAIDETNGKPKYSNETKRNIAISELKVENSEYIEMINKIKKHKNKIAKINIEIEYAKNIFNAYKAHCCNINL